MYSKQKWLVILFKNSLWHGDKIVLGVLDKIKTLSYSIAGLEFHNKNMTDRCIVCNDKTRALMFFFKSFHTYYQMNFILWAYYEL